MARCPSCNHVNPADHMYCSHCGKLLDLTTVKTRVSETASGYPGLSEDLKVLLGLTEDPEYFGPNSHVVLMATRHTQPVEFSLDPGRGVIIGRLSTNSDNQPFIDLSACGAYELGVSRSHAGLSILNTTLRITDLHSANGTFVNGLQIHPGELRVLCSGDRIQLANLKLRILFRHHS